MNSGCRISFFVIRLCPSGKVFSSPPCFAHSGEVLFFAPPKKSTQKKGDPGGLPATRVPCASRKARRSRNSLRSNRRELHPVFTAMLGCARRGRIQNQHPEPANRYPFALTEYRSHSGNKARTLFEADLPAELCAPPEGRGTQGIGAADECSRAALLFGYFLLGTQEKVPRPNGRNGWLTKAPRPNRRNRQLKRPLPIKRNHVPNTGRHFKDVVLT